MSDWAYSGGQPEPRYASTERASGYGDRYASENRRLPGDPGGVKRPRPDNSLPPRNYPPPRSDRDYPPIRQERYDDRGPPRGWRDPESLPPSDIVYGSGMGGIPLSNDALITSASRGLAGLDRGPLLLGGSSLDSQDRDMLPPDATATLFVDGLPQDCTRREASHIFRPFVGFKEVRLVHKDAKRESGEKLILCFVEFSDPRYATTALEALQGYRFDEFDRNSPALKLSFARNPGPRTGGPRDDGYRSSYRGGDYREADFRSRRRPT